jgi:hypothetical protein
MKLRVVPGDSCGMLTCKLVFVTCRADERPVSELQPPLRAGFVPSAGGLLLADGALTDSIDKVPRGARPRGA